MFFFLFFVVLAALNCQLASTIAMSTKANIIYSIYYMFVVWFATSGKVATVFSSLCFVVLLPPRKLNRRKNKHMTKHKKMCTYRARAKIYCTEKHYRSCTIEHREYENTVAHQIQLYHHIFPIKFPFFPYIFPCRRRLSSIKDWTCLFSSFFVPVSDKWISYETTLLTDIIWMEFTELRILSLCGFCSQWFSYWPRLWFSIAKLLQENETVLREKSQATDKCDVISKYI